MIRKLPLLRLPVLSLKGRGRAVGIATGYGLQERGGRVRDPSGSRTIISPYRPDLFWVHSASSPMGIGDSFPWGKVAEA